MRHHTVHDHVGPAVRRENATYLAIHGTRAELATAMTAVDRLGELIVTRDFEPCLEPGASDCFWLELVMAGHVNIPAFYAAYHAAQAANN